jgi:hypothetical protein
MARCATLILISIATVSAQFTPMFLQNGSYWGGGKSEFDFYAAEFVRDGQSHACELLMIFTPELVDPVSFAPVGDSKTSPSLPVIRMNEVATVPRGLAVEQRSTTAMWRMDFISMARLSFVGTDSIGNIAKSISEQRDKESVHWKFSSDTYLGKIDSAEVPAPGGTAVFHDELPLRVRALDFTKSTGSFDIQLAPSLANPQKEFGEFKPAKISWKTGERSIDVDLVHAGGSDHFLLDRDFPFLLREWRMADGSHLKMKNSLRVDYRSYFKNGDRERALKDPMLRHPD